MDPSTIKRLSVHDFKQQARGGVDTTSAMIVKGYTSEVRGITDPKLAGERRLQFTISTGSIDRHDDTVNPTGCKNLKSFHKNGVILWCHDSYLPPIGKPIKAWAEDKKVKAVAEFTGPELDHPLGRGFGSTVYKYFLEEYMKSVSIGFLSDDWEWSEEREWGIDFQKWELLEFSPVPVPANKEAVVELAKSGSDLRPLMHWASKCLDANESGLLVPREDIEGVHSLLADIYGGTTTVDLGAAESVESVESEEKDNPPIETKADISAANEKRLRDAAALIATVLEQLQGDEDEEEEQECSGCKTLANTVDGLLRALTQSKSETPTPDNSPTEKEIKDEISNLLQGGTVADQVRDTLKETFDRLAGKLP